MKKKEIGIIGLGKFGLQLGMTLTQLGHRVIGLDYETQPVQRADTRLAAVYSGDAASLPTLEQLRFQDMDTVIVSVGHSMESSILITLNLQKLQTRHIIVKVVSAQHAMVMERLGVHQVVQPERDAAIQTAHRINNPGMLDLLPAGGGVMLQEAIVENWAGKTLAQLALPSRLGVMVVAKKDGGEGEFAFVPDPTAPLRQGERLLLIGKPEKILHLAP